MEDPIQAARVRRRLWLAFGLAVTPWLALSIVIAARPASQRVKLLFVGFTNHGDQGRSPLFCLTNGGTRPVIYSDDMTASFRYSVQAGSGWSGPHTNRDGFGMAPPMSVLKPGESVNFEFGRPLGPRSWRIGMAYYPCEAAKPASFYYGRSVLRPHLVRAQSLGDRLAARLPRYAPARLRRWLQSRPRDPDPVAWGPVME